MCEGVAIHPQLLRLGWRDELPAAAALEGARGRLARVIEQHRAGYRVSDGLAEIRALSPPQWARKGWDPEARAVVGDWVLLEPTEDRIARLLPRRTLVARAAAGEHFRRQPIAANIDTVFVVSGLDRDFNPRRLERYLLLVRAAGCEPVIVLTKRDLCENLGERLQALDPLRGQGVTVTAVDARDPGAREALAPWLGPGQTVVLVGSSGAGKSTLTNTLLGLARQKTAAVRAADSRGRHTTTHRSLIPLPCGACLIDTPGMRELKLTGEEELAEGGFQDIEQLAARCRFRDCRHQAEPGCAVRQALDAGALDPARWAQYCKLQDELETTVQLRGGRRGRRRPQGD
ncbi:MAG: putative ribosome biogenesis GTPase RsgA [Lysobacteraceae bacterium]|nr:MAG: putative ribosome biogenesis GTPase RsgA [Xanthomonadaceae bacterium]